MKGGFLNSGPAKKPAPKQAPKVEDMTHVKAQPKSETLKMPEVQQAMAETLVKEKDSWLTPDFMQKLQSKPHLIAAFQNPQFQVILGEM